MAEVSENDGSIDTAALAISKLLGGGDTPPAEAAPAPAPEPEPEHVPDPPALEGEDIPEQPNTSEAAAVAETPAQAPQGENTTPPTQAPEAPKAPQVAEQADPQLAAISERLHQVNSIVPQLQGRMQAAFPEIKSYDDLAKLAAEDPARYFQYTVLQQQLSAATQDQAQLAGAHRARWGQLEAQKLERLIPEWKDPVKRAALRDQITEFARSLGKPESEIQRADAIDVQVYRDAMLYRDHQKQEQEKAVAHAAQQAQALKDARLKAADAPPVQKPGVPRQQGQTDKVKDARERLRKTGDVDDAAKVFALLG